MYNSKVSLEDRKIVCWKHSVQVGKNLSKLKISFRSLFSRMIYVTLNFCTCWCFQLNFPTTRRPNSPAHRILSLTPQVRIWADSGTSIGRHLFGVFGFSTKIQFLKFSGNFLKNFFENFWIFFFWKLFESFGFIVNHIRNLFE